MNRLLLVDGNALLHRAYHALPPLKMSNGQPGGAVYGFLSVIIKLQIDFHPYGFAVAFDRPEPTFRKELYKDYQIQRPEMEEELVSQIHVVHETVKKFGIQVFEKAGYEADDVIGTIVERVKNIDQVIIVTGDRDILQLVHDENVLVYMPVKGLSEAKLYGEKEVVERLGVMPNKIAEWKGLAGDSSDNYPGVPGIGPKTATDLINMYGSIEQIYAELDKGNADIKPRVAEKLIAGKESAFLSKNLATIRRDAPIEFNEALCAVSTFDTEEIRGILTELGFPSLIKRIHKNEDKEEKKKSIVKENSTSEKKDSGQLDLF